MDSSVKGMTGFGVTGAARGRGTPSGAEPASRNGTGCGGATRTSAGGGGALGLGAGEGAGPARLCALGSAEKSVGPFSGRGGSTGSASRGSVTHGSRVPPLEGARTSALTLGEASTVPPDNGALLP